MGLSLTRSLARPLARSWESVTVRTSLTRRFSHIHPKARGSGCICLKLTHLVRTSPLSHERVSKQMNEQANERASKQMSKQSRERSGAEWSGAKRSQMGQSGAIERVSECREQISERMSK